MNVLRRWIPAHLGTSLGRYMGWIPAHLGALLGKRHRGDAVEKLLRRC